MDNNTKYSQFTTESNNKSKIKELNVELDKKKNYSKLIHIYTYKTLYFNNNEKQKLVKIREKKLNNTTNDLNYYKTNNSGSGSGAGIGDIFDKSQKNHSKSRQQNDNYPALTTDYTNGTGKLVLNTENRYYTADYQTAIKQSEENKQKFLKEKEKVENLRKIRKQREDVNKVENKYHKETRRLMKENLELLKLNQEEEKKQKKLLIQQREIMMKMAIDENKSKKKEIYENRIKQELEREEEKVKQKENELLFWKMQYENKINNTNSNSNGK